MSQLSEQKINSNNLPMMGGAKNQSNNLINHTSMNHNGKQQESKILIS